MARKLKVSSRDSLSSKLLQAGPVVLATAVREVLPKLVAVLEELEAAQQLATQLHEAAAMPRAQQRQVIREILSRCSTSIPIPVKPRASRKGR